MAEQATTGSGEVFYAVMPSHHGAVEAVSLTTGKAVREVAPEQRDGLTVNGVTSGGRGALLVTYAKGPQCSSGVAGCGPKPHTCGAEVVRVDTASGRSEVVWRVGRDDLLRAATLSPDGSRLAALAAPCVPSYFNDHVAIHRLRDGATWTIGSGVPRCHALGPPHWAGDGKHVLVTYAPPASAKPYEGADGTCESTGDSSIVFLDVTRPHQLIEGLITIPAQHCTFQSVATTGSHVFAVEACGRETERLDGAAKLIEFSRPRGETGTWPIGNCTDGNSVAADDTHGVLVSAYLFCNPPPTGQQLRDPVMVLERLRGGRLHRIASVSGFLTGWDSLAW